MNRKLLFCALTFFVLMSACRKKVDVDFPDFEPTPVFNSYLVADSVIRVHLSLAGAMDTIPLALLDDATVSMYVNDTFAGNLYPDGNGYYASGELARQGSVYRFESDIPGYSRLIAYDTIPNRVPVLSFEHIDRAGVDDEGHTFAAIKISFPVEQDSISYFEVKIRVNTYKKLWYDGQLKDFHDPVLLAEGVPMALFSTENIRDSLYAMQIDYSTGHWRCQNDSCWMPLHPVFVELRSISYAYYEYRRQLYLYNKGRFPDFQFAPYQAYPLHSNVENGMGVLASYSVFRTDTLNFEN